MSPRTCLTLEQKLQVHLKLKQNPGMNNPMLAEWIYATFKARVSRATLARLRNLTSSYFSHVDLSATKSFTDRDRFGSGDYGAWTAFLARRKEFHCSSSIFPPNRQQLSEGIVHQVVQRTRPQSLDLFAVIVSSSSSMRQVGDTRLLPMNQAEMKRVAAEIELRRQRNRMHQAKHKMKQQKKVLDLEININQLRDEIQQLKMRKEVISAGVSTNTTVWSVAAEYFRLFRNGFKGPMLTLQPSASNPSSLSALQPRESFAQRDFFIATMADDVAGDTGFGVECLLENWRQLSTYHEDMEIELVRLDVGSDDDLVATVRSATTLSEKALRHGFPHLFENGEWTSLGLRLLGKRLVMSGAVSFAWNEDKGRVASLQYSVDMLTPMMHLLGNLEDAARVFARANVTPESRLAAEEDC
ncbi:uncharacterized protein IUM83_06265 [Phytophthora cinnamomi]|uniref:uncharacterized protein n=1 Tax=Phytophthora cinnamomi TaxID=4785 RepID=UPI00355A903C|nr:hypothetical protein IUM83_06265 [Phytophthora cinnamomi]